MSSWANTTEHNAALAKALEIESLGWAYPVTGGLTKPCATKLEAETGYRRSLIKGFAMGGGVQAVYPQIQTTEWVGRVIEAAGQKNIHAGDWDTPVPTYRDTWIVQVFRWGPEDHGRHTFTSDDRDNLPEALCSVLWQALGLGGSDA